VQGIEPRFFSSPALQHTFQSLYCLVVAPIRQYIIGNLQLFHTAFINVYLAPFNTAAKVPGNVVNTSVSTAVNAYIRGYGSECNSISVGTVFNASSLYVRDYGSEYT
jgi:hypothetical protein